MIEAAGAFLVTVSSIGVGHRFVILFLPANFWVLLDASKSAK